MARGPSSGKGKARAEPYSERKRKQPAPTERGSSAEVDEDQQLQPISSSGRPAFATNRSSHRALSPVPTAPQTRLTAHAVSRSTAAHRPVDPYALIRLLANSRARIA